MKREWLWQADVDKHTASPRADARVPSPASRRSSSSWGRTRSRGSGRREARSPVFSPDFLSAPRAAAARRPPRPRRQNRGGLALLLVERWSLAALPRSPMFDALLSNGPPLLPPLCAGAGRRTQQQRRRTLLFAAAALIALHYVASVAVPYVKRRRVSPAAAAARRGGGGRRGLARAAVGAAGRPRARLLRADLPHRPSAVRPRQPAARARERDGGGGGEQPPARGNMAARRARNASFHQLFDAPVSRRFAVLDVDGEAAQQAIWASVQRESATFTAYSYMRAPPPPPAPSLILTLGRRSSINPTRTASPTAAVAGAVVRPLGQAPVRQIGVPPLPPARHVGLCRVAAELAGAAAGGCGAVGGETGDGRRARPVGGGHGQGVRQHAARGPAGVADEGRVAQLCRSDGAGAAGDQITWPPTRRRRTTV